MANIFSAGLFCGRMRVMPLRCVGGWEIEARRGEEIFGGRSRRGVAGRCFETGGGRNMRINKRLTYFIYRAIICVKENADIFCVFSPTYRRLIDRGQNCVKSTQKTPVCFFYFGGHRNG